MKAEVLLLKELDLNLVISLCRKQIVFWWLIQRSNLYFAKNILHTPFQIYFLLNHMAIGLHVCHVQLAVQAWKLQKNTSFLISYYRIKVSNFIKMSFISTSHLIFHGHIQLGNQFQVWTTIHLNGVNTVNCWKMMNSYLWFGFTP